VSGDLPAGGQGGHVALERIQLSLASWNPRLRTRKPLNMASCAQRYELRAPHTLHTSRSVHSTRTRSARTRPTTSAGWLDLLPFRAQPSKRLLNVGSAERPLYISRMGCGTWNWGNQVRLRGRVLIERKRGRHRL
jgi:hypothetical protein